MSSPASSRIEQHLNDHPNGDLTVAVGYATPAGLAWLADRTRNRRVLLMIGNTQPRYWQNPSPADHAAAVAFLSRTDVEVRNWYRTSKSRHGEASAHLKVWAIHDRGNAVSVLVGSGNLTRERQRQPATSALHSDCHQALLRHLRGPASLPSAPVPVTTLSATITAAAATYCRGFVICSPAAHSHSTAKAGVPYSTACRATSTR